MKNALVVYGQTNTLTFLSDGSSCDSLQKIGLVENEKREKDLLWTEERYLD